MDVGTYRCLSPFTESEWELLGSLNSSRSIEDLDHENKTKQENEQRLCGYLLKLGAKGILKGWKHRWFVYDNRRCMLYYYRKPQDSEPLGCIDISICTFSYSADEKSLFQISSNDRTYHLQAENRNAMMFWLQELQARRREFNSQQKTSQITSSKNSCGLLADLQVDALNDNTSTELIEPVQKPATVGDHTALQKFDGGSISWNLSFTNLNKEFKNWRRSAYNTVQQASISEKSVSPSASNHKIATEFEPSISHPISENRKVIDLGFSKLVSNIRSSLSAPSISHPVLKDNLGNCMECDETRSMINVLKEAIGVAENEIKTRDEVIKSLSDQLRLSSYESKPEKSRTEEDNLDKENYIYQLTGMIRKLTDEMNNLKIILEEKNNRCCELAEKELVFKEMIQAKDNSIVELANKVFLLEQQLENATELIVVEESPAELLTMMKEEQLSYIQLKESCVAIRSQNNFLNSEILELNKLRKKDTEIINTLSKENVEKEAELLKLKSRYLWLLKEFSSPKKDKSADSELAAEMVEHLIDDAINENQDKDDLNSNAKFADRYGFYNLYENDEESLENLADHLDALSSYKKIDASDVSVGVKWENFMVAHRTNSLTRTEELKNLVRCGIPHEYRAKVWGELVNIQVGSTRNLLGVGYYATLLTEKKGIYTPSAKQIELDLLRTLPNNRFYDKIEAEGTTKLRRILLAYSWHNPTVGYCQGLNRLGAIALLYLDEESAFWCLVAIVEHLMPNDYFSISLLGAQVDQRVFKDLLEEKFPKLFSHLQSMQFDVSLISFNWFLTIFVDFFPTEVALRVWDTFLFEGCKVLFRFALAVFKIFEEDLLKCREAGPLFSFFRKIPRSRFVIDKIWEIAFVSLNPFGMRNIEAKRRYHRPLLQEQLNVFEGMRHDHSLKRIDNETSEQDQLSDDEN
ncbi:TBC1 domain family member 2B isoform X1 [Hydra vulgaris]|uniref:TBC1 domain family member 2B isoform X1 n=1 Tax=Hydra vulgaris TaxID=6087 RepID=UPI001F5ECB21|nr:TBC1 domain family member 2B-like isoform X1 [Hydra vulgaris]